MQRTRNYAILRYSVLFMVLRTDESLVLRLSIFDTPCLSIIGTPCLSIFGTPCLSIFGARYAHVGVPLPVTPLSHIALTPLLLRPSLILTPSPQPPRQLPEEDCCVWTPEGLLRLDSSRTAASWTRLWSAAGMDNGTPTPLSQGTPPLFFLF